MKKLIFGKALGNPAREELKKRGFKKDILLAVEDMLGNRGGMLLPGQRDTHTHPILQGILFEATNMVWLGENPNKEEVLKAIRERAKEQKDIFAWGYAYQAGITAQDLDDISKEGVVVLMDTAMHGSVVNTKMLRELGKRKKEGMKGKYEKDGHISEDFNFLAVGIVEEAFIDKAVDAVVRWMTKRIQEGTTAVDDKLIMTKTEAEVLKEAVRRIKDMFGYSPVRSTYVFHPLFLSNPEILDDLRSVVPLVGVKWVNDGGTRTAHFHSLTYADGTKGEPHTIPIEVNENAVAAYVRKLIVNGVDNVAWHAIGDGTVRLLLEMAPLFLDHQIDVEIQHFNLVDEFCINRAAELGIALSVQPSYTTEAFRPDYARKLGELSKKMNAIRAIAEAYEKRGLKDRLTFGTDGMPQSMLFAIACAVNGPENVQRIDLADALYHAMDEEAVMVVPATTFETLQRMDMEAIVTQGKMDGLVEKLNGSVSLVANKDRILYKKQ